ncbi:MAG: hypothetical protein IKE74_04775 [Mogibacterium sp.]|nr:hypothetical protein [Mogibacterium sp.]
MLNEKTRYRNLLIDLAWLLIVLAICYACFNLFSWMIINRDGNYRADITAYINYALDGDNRKHRLVLVLFRFLYGITGTDLMIRVYLAAEIGLIIFTNYFYIKDYSGADAENSFNRLLMRAFSLALIFSGPIYVLKIHRHFYKDTFPVFAWHSPTQQMMTLFSLAGMLFFCRVIANYEKEIKISDCLIAAVCFMLSAYSKPSFIIDLVPAIIVLFLIELFRSGTDGMWQRFKKLFIMGMFVVPSGIYLIVLNYIIYARSDRKGDSDIIVNASRFNGIVPLIIAVACSITLPLIVLLFNMKKIRTDRRFLLSWLTALMGLLQWGLLSETGSRASHGNFTWGSTIGGYILYATSLAVVMENINDENFLSGRKQMKGLYYLLLAGSLGLSVASQVYYFCTMYRGAGFWR